MMGKEKDKKAENQSMHPLWDEYTWPTKDVDEKEIPQVEGQENFYMNPYSGEISLDFPTQEQNCLGGVLADGESIPPCFAVTTADNL
jgi:DNA repair protein RAD5